MRFSHSNTAQMEKWITRALSSYSIFKQHSTWICTNGMLYLLITSLSRWKQFHVLVMVHILYGFNRMTDRELVMMVIDKTKCIWLIHHINRDYNPFKTISMTFLVPFSFSVLTAQSFDRVNTFDGTIFETIVFFCFRLTLNERVSWIMAKSVSNKHDSVGWWKKFH